MKRLILAVLLTAAAAFAQTFDGTNLWIGYYVVNANLGGCNTNSINSATEFHGYSLLGDGSALASFNLWTAVVGTMDGTEFSVELQGSDAAGLPDGSAIETHTLAAGALGTTAALRSVTGFTTTLTAGTMYWVVLKNLNASPASNYPQPCYSAAHHIQEVRGSTASIGATYAPSTWTLVGSAMTSPWYFTFSNGKASGRMGATVDASGKVYDTLRAGVRFTSPMSATVGAVTLNVYFGGTPTGNISIELYDADAGTLLGTSVSVAKKETSDGSYIVGYFPTPIALVKTRSYRAVLKNSATDSSSNYYAPKCVTWTASTDATSLRLRPFAGTLQRTTFDGSTWTDSDGFTCPVGLRIAAFSSAGTVVSVGQ